MITDLLLFLLSALLSGVTTLLPTWQIWPDSLLTGLTYFFSTLSGLNFILPIDTFLTVLTFFFSFEVAYFTAKIVMKLFNYVRGTGSGLDL